MATWEQQRADEDTLTLLKKQEEEKKEAFNKFLDFEKLLDSRHKMELMKHMSEKGDATVKGKMKEMDEKLKETIKMEEMEKLQQENHDHSHMILGENKKLKSELSHMVQVLKSREKQLDQLAARNEIDRRKLEDEKKKNELKNNSLQMAIKETQKAVEVVLALVNKQEEEKKAAINKILELEKQLDRRHQMELEIQYLKSNREVMKHMCEEGDATLKEKMKEMDERLQDKIEEVEGLEDLNQTLVVKERKTNDELQEARKELIMVLREMSTSNRAFIGIKRMGEMDEKPFVSACKEIFSKEDAYIKVAEYCSKWQDELRNQEWHPFKVIEVEGKHQVHCGGFLGQQFIFQFTNRVAFLAASR